MPNPTTYEKIKSLDFSAFELKGLTGWPDAVIEDYLNTIRALTTISELIDAQIDTLLEDIQTGFQDGSIPFVDSGYLVENNTRLKWDNALNVLTVGGVISSQGRRRSTKRITSGPYDILTGDEVIMVDTDSGAITTRLPAGVSGQSYKISNSGSSGNDVTVLPDGSELLFGSNSSEYLRDGENIEITYDIVEGWQ